MLAHVSGDSWRLVHLAVSHGVTCLWNLLWTAWICARKMTFSWCDVHTQLFSLKIAGVEQILSMQQPLTVWAVSGADAKRLREERLARAGAAQAKALAIGLPWPKPAKGATGWSVKGEKMKQVHAGKSNITATLAVPMLQGPSFCQLIFGGKTSAVLPHGPVEHDVHLNFTESHWQSTESMFSFVQFLEKVLNPTDEQPPWILLLDCASVHTASAFRQQLHSQLPWVKSIYIPRGSAAYNQPLDRSMMKSFKSAVARKASRHFAEQILLVASLDLFSSLLETRHCDMGS